jgi:hypothetical protein
MKKGPLIAIGILVVLAGIYLLTDDDPATKVEAPMTIAAVENLSRLEIVPPEESDAELIVFEKREDDWWITRPVEARASRSAQREINALFDAPIKTDDLDLDEEKLRSYLLDEPSAVRLSAYAEGSDKPALELVVGEEIEVAETGVRRTYIQKAGESQVYRAQIGLGDFLREPVSELRTREMVDLDASDVTSVTVAARAASESGDSAKTTKLKLTLEEEAWKMVEPAFDEIAEEGETLDESKVKSLVRRLAGLRADGFADDKKAAEVGLEPALTTVTMEVDGETHILRLGESVEDKKIYAKFDDGPIFTIGQSTGDRLTPEADSLLKAPEEEDEEETKVAESDTK